MNIEKTSSEMHTTGLMDSLPDFDDSLFEGGRERIKQTRSEKRRYRQKHQKGGESSSLEKDRHTLDMSAPELISLQGTDPTLAEVRKAVKSYSSSAGVRFFEKNGLIYRHWIPPGRGTEDMAVDQLVLPQQCRSTVLDLAHRIPLAGHLGRDKTAQPIMQRFYWPTLYSDVAQLVRTCAVCQKTAPGGCVRAPLMPLPVIAEPFRRIAMDIIGPLPKS